MQRLIDANALIEFFEHLIEKSILEDTKIHYMLAIETVKAQPTVEAEPVRHGRWIYGGYDEYPTCSYCKQSDTYAGDYCGNCGARMDLRTPT